MSHTGSYEMTDVPTSNGRTEKIGVDIPSKGYDNYGLSGSSEEELSKVDLGSDECPGFDVTKNMGSEDDDDNEKNCCSRGVASIQNSLSRFYTDYNDTIWLVIYIVVALLYFAYFAYCMWYSFGDEGSVRLLVVTVLATLFIVVRIFLPFFESRGISPLDSLKNKYNSTSASRKKQIAKYMTWLYWCFMVGYAIFAIVYVIVDVGLDTPENLISAGGVAFFVISFYIFSVNPAAVRWRPVLWGLYIQFAFALIILRWEFGYQAFNWLGMRVQEFLQHSDEGAKFVFGDLYINHFFAFKVLPVIVFFSTMMSVLYYLGVMQFVIRHIARALAFALGTSPAESLNAAGNIFIGQSEAPLMIRPFINKLTKSELHAVMTGGFATIAGSVMAAYISYGVPANHLIAASVMSAPAALAMAKLFYPETEETLATAESVYDMENSEHSNVIAAASEGASTSISLISNIAANLIAFISILAFVNATLKWCGHRAGLHDPELTFELICSYVFWPMAYIMGVHADDCRKVGELIGVKTFLNEFVAYTRLSVFIKNKDELHKYIVKRTTLPGWENATVEYIKGDIFLSHINKTLIGGTLSDRSEVISTYALCGFSNIGSLGIMIGALGALAPSRKTDITQTVVRAMIAGNVACFLTASIAGLLYRDPIAGIMSNSTS